MRGPLLLSWTGLLVVVTLPAQTPARDQPRVQNFGTAIVRGVVVADDDKRAPLRRATVTLTRSGIEDIRMVATDDTGGYSFDRLPPGSYTLSAYKGAYIGLTYGAAKPGMPGSSITLAEGQAFVAKPIALMRGAVIAGRITDRNGRPAATFVRAEQFVTIGGERRRRAGAGTSGTASTDAHGEFRISGLLPGDYFVSSTSLPLALQPEATAAELAWASQPTTVPPPPRSPLMLAATLFPGTADPRGAAIVTLARAEERTGVDFSLQYVPVSRVSGTVTGVDGQPAAFVTVLCAIKDPSPIVPASGTPVSQTQRDGLFACNSLAPGAYMLIARSVPAPSPVSVGLERGPAPSLSWGMTEVNVAGSDISDVAIRLQPGLIVRGQIDLRPSSAVPAPDVSRFIVRFTPVNTAIPTGLPPAATIQPDGTFQMDGIVPGTYRLTVTNGGISPLPAGWSLRSAMLGDRDVADLPVEIRQNTTGLNITLSDVQTELTGTIADRSGQPAPQLYVLVFPTDRSLWINGSRRIAFVRSNESGAYRLAGLPPGEYFLSALTEIETAVQYEPEYLQQFVPTSLKITLTEGEKKVQPLLIGG